MLRRPLLIILLAFVVSVVVRVPQLDRPLSAHHEFCTAVALIILHNWHTDGYFTHHGNPIVSFTGPADRYPPGFADGPAEHDGLIYYFSHPPFAYDVPYALFQITGSAPNVIGLQLLNLAFHLITAWCLFLAIRALFPSREKSNAPVFAAVLYLFMPAPLWFHSNVYMSDMFVQNFWVMHLAIALRMYVSDRSDRKLSIAFFVTLFLSVLTSWLGVFAAMASGLVALWKWREERSARWLFPVVLTALAVAMALGYTTWRYTRVVELDQLIAFFHSRFEVRGSVGLEEGVWPHIMQMIVNYRMGFLPLLIIFIAIAFFKLKGVVIKPILRPDALVVFIPLTGLPVLLDHVFLLQYADHDFTVLKAGPILCGLAAIGIAQLEERWSIVLVTATCLAGVLYFYRINPLPDGARYAYEQNIGQAIAAHVLPGEAAFTLGSTPEPQVQWYAKRTLFRIDSLPQAEALLRAQRTRNGVVFRLTDQGVTSEKIQVILPSSSH